MRRFSVLLLISALSVPSAQLFGQYEGKWRAKPQLGIWFGPVTPVPGSALSERLKTNLGGGTFFRINLPSDTWRSEIGISYSYYNSDGPEALHSVPFYGAAVYKMPFDLPITTQSKLGFGGMYMQNRVNHRHNTHPMALLGFELSFPAGKWVNIGVRADYYFVYEKHVDPPETMPDFKMINGHFLNFGLMVNFNLAR